LDILRSIFNQIIIPDVVHQEILQGASYQAGLLYYQQANWIQVLPVKNQIDPLL